MKQWKWILLLWGCVLTACGSRTSTHDADGGEKWDLKYSHLLSMVDRGGYTVATVQNPWDTLQVLHTYVLVPDSLEMPLDLPKGTVIRTPLKRSLVYSAVHISLMEELGVLSSLAGVCDLKYIGIDTIHRAVAKDSVMDCGDAMQPDIERIMDLNPEGILLSPFENSGGYGRVEKLGIPLIECADYMENSALGRAEWMRFYGCLWGCSQQADSLFREVEKQYLHWKELAQASTTSLSVICERKSGSAWYVPGGKSTVAGLYADACVRYPFADNPKSGSVPMAFETVFDRAGEADVWLIKYNSPRDLTYDDLKAEYAGYAAFKAFREQQIYGCNTARIPYYEETPFHPERLLADMIQIFHPDLKVEDELRYFSKLP